MVRKRGMDKNGKQQAMTRFLNLTGLIPCVITSAALIFFALPVPRAVASGFALFTQGAKEMGMLNAVVAHTEGPASNFYNPALIAELAGTQLEIGTTLIFPDREFTDAAGKTTKAENNVFYPSTFFMTKRLNEKLTAGLGVCSTFGLGTEWPGGWPGRYVSTKAELLSFNVNPNLAWQVTNKLVVAGGFDLLRGDATLERDISLAGMDDAAWKFSGDGHGWGYNLGLLYNINEAAAFGLSYRSRIDLKLNGDVSFDLPAGAPPIFTNIGGNVELPLPPQMSAGFSYKVTDRVVMEVSGRWEGWSRYENLEFHFDAPPVPGGVPPIPKNWEDVYGFMFGIKYNLDPSLALAAGYLHEENPVPDATFEPSITAADKNMFSLGLQKSFGRYSGGITYLYAFFADRTKNNDVGDPKQTGIPHGNGEYKQDIHMLAASVKVKF